MTDLLPFLLAGLVTGSVYGLAAVGLVLTYKTSGLFNFAHGAIATVSAYAFYSMYVLSGTGWQVAALICVFIVGPAMGLALELLARAVARATLELRIAATIGILLVVVAGVKLYYGETTVRNVPSFLPEGGFTMSETLVKWSDVITFGIALVATVILSLALQFTRRGVAMRAVVEDPDLLDLAGTSPVVTRRFAWCIGSGLAALTGVLFAPLLPLDPLYLTLLVVQAFGAAAIGRFTSLPWSFAGGLMVGVLSSLATKYFTDGLLAGLPSGLPFLALFLVLLLLPKRYLVERSRGIQRVRSDWSTPAPMQLAIGAMVLVLLAFVPSFAGIHLTTWTIALAMTIVFLSLGLLVRTSGQVSLCHVAFAAIGASTFSHLTLGWEWPWLLALLGSGLVAIPIGAVLAIPAIRLSGLYLALATFGFGIVLQVMFYTQDYMFGNSGIALGMPRPTFLGLESDKGYYYLVLVFLGVATGGVVALNRSRLGRLLRGLADSPTALRTNGVTIDVTRLLVFCISAFMAAIGGALAGVAASTVSADSFQPLLSLTYFALIVVVVGNAPWYALMAAAALVLVPEYVAGPLVADWMQVIFGAAAVAVAIAAGRLRVPIVVREALDSMFRGRGRAALVLAKTRAPKRVPTATLEVDSLTVRFGGVVAVDGFSLLAPTGQITGLIGPNGAGKTTTFNACTGLVRASDGSVRLDGDVLNRASTPLRARKGIGRTFQKMELFDSLTVHENVAMGAEGPLAGANPIAHVLGRPGHARQVRESTDQALGLCGIADLASRRVGSLSTGQRRLVELARCLAGPYTVLLLDEPSSGLDHAESARFGQILRDVVNERGVGILLVEHDMSLVLEICDDIFVLDFGKPIFHGDPDAVRNSEIVQHAYLGSPNLESELEEVGEIA